MNDTDTNAETEKVQESAKAKKPIINFDQIRMLVGQLGLVLFSAGILDHYLVEAISVHTTNLLVSGGGLMLISIFNWENLKCRQ